MRYLYIFILLIASASASAQPGRKARPVSDGLDFRHLASFTPFSFAVSYGYFNPVAGIDYEYILSAEHGVGLHIPLMVGYTGPEQGYGNRYNHSLLYTAPGIRFHTARRGSHVDFVTGPAVMFGNLHFKPSNDYLNPTVPGEPYNYGMVGLIADNSLNFYRNHFVFGFDLRLGTMIERENSTQFFMHLGMHFGGKF